MSNRLKAVYDLRVLPATFDFMGFLACADAHRLEHFPHADTFDVIIIVGESLRGKEFTNTSSQDVVTHQRVQALLLPLAQLHPAVQGISLVDLSIAGLQIQLSEVFFPVGYNASKPELYRYYKNPMLWEAMRKFDLRNVIVGEDGVNEGRALLQRICGESRPVVFTIRNNRHGHDRSRDNTERVLEIAKCISKVYPVVIVPDTADVYEGLQTDLPLCMEASLDVKVRARIYQAAHSNILGNNGPGFLCLMNRRINYLFCGWATGEYFTPEWFEYRGLERNSNPFACGDDHQVIDWDELTEKSALEFLARIDGLLEA